MPKGEVERPLGSSAKLYLEQLSLLECDKDRNPSALFNHSLLRRMKNSTRAEDSTIVVIERSVHLAKCFMPILLSCCCPISVSYLDISALHLCTKEVSCRKADRPKDRPVVALILWTARSSLCLSSSSE